VSARHELRALVLAAGEAGLGLVAGLQPLAALGEQLREAAVTTNPDRDAAMTQSDAK
jgi:hypothetical protein